LYGSKHTLRWELISVCCLELRGVHFSDVQNVLDLR